MGRFQQRRGGLLHSPAVARTASWRKEFGHASLPTWIGWQHHRPRHQSQSAVKSWSPKFSTHMIQSPRPDNNYLVIHVFKLYSVHLVFIYCLDLDVSTLPIHECNFIFLDSVRLWRWLRNIHSIGTLNIFAIDVDYRQPPIQNYNLSSSFHKINSIISFFKRQMERKR